MSYMKRGPKPTYANAAERQEAYRNRKASKDTVNEQLAKRTAKLLEVAIARGIVTNIEGHQWQQVEELTQWLESH